MLSNSFPAMYDLEVIKIIEELIILAPWRKPNDIGYADNFLDITLNT